MSVEKLKKFLDNARGEHDSGYESDPSWRRYLSDSARQRYDDREYRPESERPRHTPARIALTAVLAATVLGLLVIVSNQVIPLAKTLPSPIDQFQSALAEFHLSDGGEKKSNSVIVAVPQKHKAGGGRRAVSGLEPLPPYKGVIHADLVVTPLNTVHPFTVQVEDGHKRQNLEITDKPLVVDIDEADQAVMQTSAHADTTKPFDLSVDLSGPEADHVANALTNGNQGVPARNIERHVGLLAVIDKNGKVTDIRRVNGSAALAQAAIDTVRRSRFRQFYENGKPVEMQTLINVSFTIPAS